MRAEWNIANSYIIKKKCSFTNSKFGNDFEKLGRILEKIFLSTTGQLPDSLFFQKKDRSIECCKVRLRGREQVVQRSIEKL